LHLYAEILCLSVIAHSLVLLQLAAVGSSIDVVKVAERQPSLLLSEDMSWDDPQSLQERLVVSQRIIVGE
jgi:hypothetical protein